MLGYDDIGPGVPAEQLALLKSRNFSIRPLSTAGHLDAWRAIELTWQPIAIFIFAVTLLSAVELRFSGEAAVVVIYYVGLTALMLAPLVACGLVLLGVVAAGVKTRVRPSAVVYWTWWPFWRCVLCVTAATVGSSIGNHLWYKHFFPHTRMQRLQAYSAVDPSLVGSKRLQDAGVVAFNSSAGVDRTRAGCLKDGVTYCVAPILHGGQLPQGNTTGAPQDLFMSGVNCCECPGEFRCGDWNVPMPLGGLRVLDAAQRSFFALAAEEWAARHGQAIGQPMFFEWVADPVGAYNELRDRGVRLKAMALVVGPLLFVLAVVALNGALALLRQAGLAAPLETPLPPPGLGRALSSRLLPHMHRHHEQEQVARDPWQATTSKYVIL